MTAKMTDTMTGTLDETVESSYRRVVMRATVLILALQFLDMFTTLAVFRVGGIEANPITAWLFEYNLIWPLKIGIPVLSLTTLKMKRSETTLMLVCASWWVCGFYTMLIISNLLTLSQYN